MLELFLLTSLIKRKNGSSDANPRYFHNYATDVFGEIFLSTYLKPKWQSETNIYDAFVVNLNKNQYTISAFRCKNMPDICFLELECPKDRYQTIKQEDRIELTKTQEILQMNDFFAPAVNSGHFIQLQIPIKEARIFLMQGLRADFLKIFPESNLGVLLAFDFLFFFLFDYIFFAKPELQVIHIAKKEEIDPDTLALIQWCTEVEGFLVAAGATLREAQGYIEEQAEWFTDQFYEGLTPQEAAKASLNEP